MRSICSLGNGAIGVDDVDDDMGDMRYEIGE